MYPMLIHPEKYCNKRKVITIRSSYEYMFAKFCDTNENVVSWSSEETIIPYYFPYVLKNNKKLKCNNKQRRYFMDFDIIIINKDGATERNLIEVKPYTQVIAPKKPTPYSMFAYEKNIAKWNATKLFCEKLRNEKNENVYFKIITEQHLKELSVGVNNE